MKKVKDITNKVCKICKEDKTTEHYSFDNANQRYESLCKSCKNDYNREYIKKNRDRYNAYMRERYYRLKLEKNGINN